MQFISVCRALVVALALCGASAAWAQIEVVKIAVIDPLSGLAAVTGANQLHRPASHRSTVDTLPFRLSLSKPAPAFRPP